jgi:hypothetical protein
MGERCIWDSPGPAAMLGTWTTQWTSDGKAVFAAAYSCQQEQAGAQHSALLTRFVEGLWRY